MKALVRMQRNMPCPFRKKSPAIRAPQLSEIGCAIGQGLLAGAAGTAAITGAQLVEMKLTGRKPSHTPEKAGARVLGVEPTSEERAGRFGNMVHWFYGTTWGIPRGMLSLFGITGARATVLHFLKIWIAGMAILPALKASSPPWKWGLKPVAMDGLLHVVYAVGAGVFFDHFRKPEPTRKFKIFPRR